MELQSLLGVITVLAILFLTGSGTDDKDILRQTFQIDAVYYDSGHVEISFLTNLIKQLCCHGNSWNGGIFSKNIF